MDNDSWSEEHTGSYNYIVEVMNAMHGLLKDLYKSDFAKKIDIKGDKSSINSQIKSNHSIKRRYTERIIYDTITEFIHFTDTSLLASRTRKHSVAFALLRKPFREILDTWLLIIIDPDDYVEKLFEKPEEIDVSKYKVRKSLREKINNTPELYKSGFNENVYKIYHKMRYNTEDELTLSKLMTQANHILTTSMGQESEEGTLNFVHFTSLHDKPLWDIYYSSLKALIQYAGNILQILVLKYTTNFHSDSIDKLYNLTWNIR